MLIGGDDIYDDVITLGRCLHSRSFPLRADWGKSDSSVEGKPKGQLEVELKFPRRSCKLSFLRRRRALKHNYNGINQIA